MNHNLYLLLGRQLVSQAGGRFHMLAVAFMVMKTTGPPARMGQVLFCSIFPGMVLARDGPGHRGRGGYRPLQPQEDHRRCR
ncbi:MAG: hypothetical protein LJE94_01980 [Deltaproteobacteria bacterium]|nr:hypothetical protein [Deltaproteobacteria bacterium]